MKKWIFTTLFALLITGAANATVIFDPATYAGTLPAGASIVEIESVKYLKISPNGWNTNITINDIAIPAAENKVKCYAKFKQGTGAYGAADQETFIKVYKDGTTTQEEFSCGGFPSSETFFKYVNNTKEFTANRIQFAFMDHTAWQASVGDTMWVGKIETYTLDPTVIFDPATFDGTLPAGTEIVTVGDTKYLKVTTASWGDALAITIDAFATGTYNKWKCMMKTEVGTTGKTIDVLSTTLEASDGGTNKPKLNKSNNAAFEEVKSDLPGGITLKNFKVFVQEAAGSWPAVDGAIVYIGKITASEEAPTNAVAPRTGKIIYYDQTSDVFELDGIDAEDIWTTADTNNVARIALGTVADAADNSGYFQLAYDFEYLYLFASITDNDPIDISPTSTQPWNNDGIELFIDHKNERIVGKQRIDGQQHQFRCNLGQEANPLIGNKGMPGFFGDNDTTNINFAQVKSSNGYTIEMAIPMATVYRLQAEDNVTALLNAETALAGSTKIAFEISILDANAADTRKSILNWSNNTGQDKAYSTAEFWGEMEILSTTSVKSIETVKFNMYPNPANSAVTIKMTGLQSFSVIDITGRIVMSNVVNNDIATFNVSDLSAGIYLIQVQSTKGISVQKLKVD